MENKDNKTVQAGSFDNYKDVLEISIPNKFVLVQIVEKESKIIKPVGVGVSPGAKAKIIKVGEGVEGVNVGDLIVDLKSEVHGVHYFKKEETTFILTDQYNLLAWTPEDNYEG